MSDLDKDFDEAYKYYEEKEYDNGTVISGIETGLLMANIDYINNNILKR